MKKRMTIMIIALAVIFGGIIAFNLIKSFMIKRFFAHYEAPAVTVSSVIAKQQSWKPHLTTVGNFMAMNGVDVNAQIGGNVVAIHFKSGQFIDKDQPLIDIDDAVDQATLKYNQAGLTLQTINYKRQQDLFKRNAAALSTVDDTHARLLEAQANIEKIQALIDQKHLKAPFSGMLGIRKINLGQYVKPGETTIVTLQSMDPLYLDFYLPEQQIENLELNQTIRFTVEQNPNLIFTGKITAINSRIDSNTHTIQVQATLNNCPIESLTDPLNATDLAQVEKRDDGKIIITCDSERNTQNHVQQFNFMPGMFAAIEVEQPIQSDIIVLPTTAISYTLYGNSVFVIDHNKNKDNQEILTVRRVFVKTGDEQGNYTIITQGLKPGTEVVASGELKLQNGTRVSINNSVSLSETKNIDALGQ